MASGDLVRYVITVMLHEDTLTEINELNNYLTRDGFLLTMTDDEGNIHELGTNTFGLISTQSEEEIRELVSGHCCKVSDEAAFCLIQRPYISKTLLTRRISPRGSP
ncbi:endoribonuclease GhoS [Escherichia coli]|nr:type V toxin-antitoxin system endoribonuclease antitoxin GhoS [Escherichia coli]MCY0114249.1 type V toxin-antitoxin system endoribonuclease antitoxin GhoS [Escherichia coli]MQH21702.1 endoribonuclease GhoS [Escherichia coli]MQJ38350.1 endoribonuclease GhoS [Escherichia coli]